MIGQQVAEGKLHETNNELKDITLEDLARFKKQTAIAELNFQISNQLIWLAKEINIDLSDICSHFTSFYAYICKRFEVEKMQDIIKIPSEKTATVADYELIKSKISHLTDILIQEMIGRRSKIANNGTLGEYADTSFYMGRVYLMSYTIKVLADRAITWIEWDYKENADSSSNSKTPLS